MPLCEKARVEVYLPDLPRAAYQDLLTALAREFTYTFGGCTIISGLDGSYLSQAGVQVLDRINLIYTDTPYAFEENFEIISQYADKLRAAAFTALAEDAILGCRAEGLSRGVTPRLSVSSKLRRSLLLLQRT